ncbi:ParB/RepB/Spo0J family partition protein [Kitasatospora sp. NPDC059327]|uniref:ParB/RepB/Spo0J family partition protein n=1 Tax=Kitasatospora sp. NPDC059327 TaxID=3346803 RepID=UPI00368C5D60
MTSRTRRPAEFPELREPPKVKTRAERLAEYDRRQEHGEAGGNPEPVPLSARASLKELAHNPFNPREELTDIEETAESLRTRGQLTPASVVSRAAFLAVHPETEEKLGEARWVVIDGNRRLASAPLAGLEELRIDVNDALARSAHDLLEVSLIANIFRVDVPPIDQARAIQQLLAVHGTQDAVAARLNKSKGWVSQRLALLGLPEDLQEKVDSKDLNVRDARRIGRIADEGEQRAEAEAAMSRPKASRGPRSGAAIVSQKNTSASEVVYPVNVAAGTSPEITSHHEIVYPVNTPDVAPPTIASAVHALVRLTETPARLADSLAEHLEPDVLHAVAERLLLRVT